MKLIHIFITSILVLCPGISMADTSHITTEALKSDDPVELMYLQAPAEQSSDTYTATEEPSIDAYQETFSVFSGEFRLLSETNILNKEVVTVLAQSTLTEEEINESAEFEDNDFLEEYEEESPRIADPIAPFNKVMFHFNDKLYFWLLKPVTQVYSYIIPEDFRFIFSNAYDNLKAPGRMVNNLLQLRPKAAGNEIIRFVFNSVVGVGGLGDPAKHVLNIKKQDADLGQTLGHYGIGHGVYLVLPVFGPSSIRDGIGLAGDRLMYPLTYVSSSDLNLGEAAGISAHEKVNDTSFKIGDYESFKESAIDPYVSMRDAFIQHRKKDVEESKK